MTVFDDELEARQIEPVFFEKLGRFITRWALIETGLVELLTACLQSEPGMTLLLSQQVSASTLTQWVRTMSQLGNNPKEAVAELEKILDDINVLRTERNALVHGLWVTNASGPGTVIVHTLRLHKTTPTRERLITPAELDALIQQTLELHHRLNNFLVAHGIRPS